MVVGFGENRLPLQSLIATIDCRLGTSECEANVTEFIPQLRIGWLDLDSLGNTACSVVVPPDLMCNDTRKVPSISTFLVTAKNQLAFAGRASQVATSVQFECARKFF